MELRTYWRIFARRWWLALLPALVVAVYTLVTYDQPPVQYQTHVNFTAGLAPEDKPDVYTYDTLNAWLASEYVANGLADVARRERFASAVSARMAAAGATMPDGQPIPPGAIQGAIASDNAQSLFVVYMTWGDPDTLQAMADAVTLELTENAAAYFPQLAGFSRPPARPVDVPAVVSLPPSLRAQLTGPAIRIGLALAAGLALVFVLHYVDPTVRERSELEALGYQVLAEIPRRSWFSRRR